MTTWKEVFERGNEVAPLLMRKGRPVSRYANDYGAPVDGWQLGSLGCITHDIEYSGSSNYDESYDENYLVLGNDGVIYLYRLLKSEKGRRESGGFRITVDKTSSLRVLDSEMSYLVSYKRPKTDEVMGLLEQLARKENSDPEPTAPSTRKEETFNEDAVKPALVQAPTSRSVEPTPGQHIAVGPVEEPKEETSSWGLVALLAISPFIFLAILCFILFLCGARPN